MIKKSFSDIIRNAANKGVKKALSEMAISKDLLSEYDSIEIFNDTYIKVYKNGLYNLVDNDGNYLSTSWFTDIKRNNGGGVDVIVKDDKGNERKRSYTDYHDIKKSDELVSLVKHTDFLDYIDMKDIIMVTPYVLQRPNMKRGVKIIALVKYMGQMLLLGSDGILYNSDGTKYVQVKFAVSEQDLYRFSVLADKISRKLNSEYDPELKNDDFVDCKYGCSCFIFGFNSNEMEYNTCRSNLINKSNVNTWGGDSVKVRFFVKNVKNLNAEYFTSIIEHMDFVEFTGSNHKSLVEYKAYTKQYQPTELDDLYADLNQILSL